MKKGGCFWALVGVLAVGFVAMMLTAGLLLYTRMAAPSTVTSAPPSTTASPTSELEMTRTPVATAAAAPTTGRRTPLPKAETSPLPKGWELVEKLMLIEPPPRDRPTLTERLHPELIPVPRVVPKKRTFREGDTDYFWVLNEDTKKYRRIAADLRFVLPHLYVWVERGIDIDNDGLFRSAERFDRKTYPTDRSFFGSEWTPGVDRDVHISILHTKSLGSGVAGYFSASDEVTSAVNRYSNQREMFYVDPSSMKPNTKFYDGTLAHEFQHMIHWYEDRNEDTWINEGCSELASFVNGFDPGDSDSIFTERPDTQLDNWDDNMDENAYHYGASYLLMEYSYERFGKSFIKKLVSEPLNGIEGYDAALKDSGDAEDFYTVFSDWIVANLLDNISPNVKKFRYSHILVLPPKETEVTGEKYSHSEDVHQFGADYYQVDFNEKGTLSLEFSGDTSVPIAPFEPHSGKFVWWGHSSDDSDATLTRDVDLSGASSATLNFWTWYDIEKHYDYAYVMVSADGGKSWKILPGRYTTEEDPVGNALGPGYTGKSGGGSTPKWIHEKIDLSDFAGKKIKLRFEYVTDDAVTKDGFFVDDISIPEIGWKDNAEKKGDWESRGFSLVPSRLPQRWIVQVIGVDEDGNVTVKRMKIVDGRGKLYFDDSAMDTVDVAISAATPITKHKAKYTIKLYAVSKDGSLAADTGP